MNNPKHTLFPFFLRWENEPLERRYAVAFVTRENYRQDIVNLAGDKGVDGLLYILMNFTFCTDCDRVRDESLANCECPVEGVKRASFHSLRFSENFWTNMESASEEEPNCWGDFCAIDEDFDLQDDPEQVFGETILFLWGNMTFSIVHYYPDNLSCLFDTLDEFGCPTGQLFKPLHTPFLIDIESPAVWDDEEEEFRRPTKQEEESEVGMSFLGAKIPEIILETIKKDDVWSEFTSDAQEAWYDDISFSASDMSFHRWMPGIEELQEKITDELDDEMLESPIESEDGFLRHESDAINPDVKGVKELEAGCYKTAMFSFHDIDKDDSGVLIEISFHFYVGSVVKVKVSAMQHGWKPLDEEDAEESHVEEMDFTNAKLLHREVLVFAPEPLARDEEGNIDINDVFDNKPKVPDFDLVFAAFKRAQEAI